jgi:hypothetical protein
MNEIPKKCSICNLTFDETNGPHFEAIIPLFHSEEHMEQVREYVTHLNSSIPGGIALTFVADGRVQDYEKALELQGALKLKTKAIKLSRNFGVGPALHAALADSQYCMSTAFGSDLQEPVEVFVDFFKVLSSGNSDLVLGYRTQRKDPYISKKLAQFYWWVNRKFIYPSSPPNGFDVFAMSKTVRTEFSRLRELNTNFTSQLLWIGFDPTWIGFVRSPREIGRSTWSHRRKFKLFADSLYGYTSKPISLITNLGLFSSLSFLFIAFLTLLGKLTNQINVPGYVMTILLISIGQSILLFSIGVIGGYVSRTFENGTERPHYIISKRTESGKLDD